MISIVTSKDNVRDNLQQFLLANGCDTRDVKVFMKDTFDNAVTHYPFNSAQGFKLILSLRLDDTFKDKELTTPEKKMAKGIINKFVYISNNSNFLHKSFSPPTPVSGSERFMFNQIYMMYNPLNHFLQPAEISIYRRVTDTEFFQDYAKTIDTSSRVYETDPVARFLLARCGDVVEYRNSSATQGIIKFRIVVPKYLDD